VATPVVVLGHPLCPIGTAPLQPTARPQPVEVNSSSSSGGASGKTSLPLRYSSAFDFTA